MLGKQAFTAHPITKAKPSAVREPVGAQHRQVQK